MASIITARAMKSVLYRSLANQSGEHANNDKLYWPTLPKVNYFFFAPFFGEDLGPPISHGNRYN